jgi:predicted DCC family thiol-disulfide oxidoreductase YuxK
MESDNIVFFDGYCNLCNQSVDFLIRHDKKRKLKYASQQSEFSLQFFFKHKYDILQADSFIFFRNGKFYNRSTAFFQVMRVLGFPYNLLWVFIVFPRFLRDLVYDWIAKNRYKWFGKRETCRLPTTEEKSLFLE